MTDPAGTPRGPEDRAAGVADEADRAHDAGRRRTTVRILLVGSVLSLLAAVAAGLFGIPGAVAGAVFLSLLSLTSGLAGATLAVFVLVDQFRGAHVSVARVLLSGALLLLTLVLLIASAGAFVAAVETRS